jgi:hypothetical protein
MPQGGQPWPKLRFGETHADQFCCLQGCIVGPSLLALLHVARSYVAR